MSGDTRPLCGFLNVLKPPGMTSARVVGFARRLINGAKVGHAGTLDPEAAGVLPLMVGKAARLFDYMQDKEKEYVFEAAFGCSTDTKDAQGAVVDTGDNYPSQGDILSALPFFTGDIMQRPPMYSAIKQGGKRLYQIARSGGEAVIPERPVTVHKLELLSMTEPHGALLRVVCSKGFYVRSLAEDMGAALGCPSHMRFLLRTRSGVFSLDTAKTLEEIAEAAESGCLSDMLLPMEAALSHMPCLPVPPECEARFLNGVRLEARGVPGASELIENEPFRLTVNGRLAAIAVTRGGGITIRTWLL